VLPETAVSARALIHKCKREEVDRSCQRSNATCTTRLVKKVREARASHVRRYEKSRLPSGDKYDVTIDDAASPYVADVVREYFVIQNQGHPPYRPTMRWSGG